MNVTEETIDATLDQSGQLQLAHQPRLPPGPVQVTIRVAATVRGHSVLQIPAVHLGAVLRLPTPDDDLLGEMLEGRR
jgi:hypothetical protein